MFRWFRNLFARRTAPPERFLFRYRDGTRTRSCDPVAADTALREALGQDWWQEVRALRAKPPAGLIGVAADEWQAAQYEKRKKILDAICVAFGVERYSDPGDTPPRGLTESELLGLLTGYMLYCADLARLARPFLRPSSPASRGDDGQPPPSTPASSSSATGSPANEPTLSPPPSFSPSSV